jgi:small subunit ribosomal protein S18
MSDATFDTTDEQPGVEHQVMIQGRRRIITSAPAAVAASNAGGVGGRRRYTPRRKIDPFRADKVEPDYKDIRRLSRCISEQGKILPRRRLGTDAKMQRKLATEIKRARHMALLPFVATPTRG